ncbi:beta-lactamase protein [Salinisphaera shabanensis E1L3A]|uniref:Beta-lactamase n=1 Tax=Salinisphaera shabanensis E1L3A TaxID=1033802 RepID=U2G169_9GAMM|nr:class A beta-lactamase [Salinisphaera shabanensis]ERJ19993.1 beta-lactamase protein [Salinisphaera shabanensis E1L3A]
MTTRRRILKQLTAGAALSVLGMPAVLAREADDFAATMHKLEKRHGGRLGVCVLDTGSDRYIAQRGDERFLLCSTFKVVAAAMILSRVDAGEESLDRHIDYATADLVTYSPETEKHAGTGMTLGAICRAAITLSDNTAGNLMLQSLGGPKALTAFMRSLGDDVTRLDRYETALNEYTPGNPHDSTTPRAMVGLMQKILLGDRLTSSSRDQLIARLEANETGDNRLRAGLSESWRIGDKTGSGGNNTANDIAITWPEGGAPVLIATYYTGSSASKAQRDRVLADVGAVAARWHGIG